MTPIAQELWEALPESWRLEDQVLRVVFGAVAPALEPVETAITNLSAFFHPQTAPDSWLEWLIYRVGWPHVHSLTPYQLRRILLRIPHWRRVYGQAGMLEEVIAYCTRPTAGDAGVSVSLTPRKPIKGGLRIGRGRIGKARVWNFLSNNEIHVAVTQPGSLVWDDSRAAYVRGLLELFLPPWMTFTLTDNS